MPRKTARVLFNEIAHYQSPCESQGLIFAVRTDAHHATESLKTNLLQHVLLQPDNSLNQDEAKDYVEKTVHGFYKIWGHDVLRALSENLHYELYGIDKPRNKFLQVHFYNAKDLAKDTLARAAELAALAGAGKNSVPPVYVSLDSLIDPDEVEHRSSIEFSRVFSLDGNTQSTYTARPGSEPLEVQLDAFAEKLQEIKAQYGMKVPFVLLEDNIRHAKMLNWFIEKLKAHGVFDHGHLAGIATSFCCAPQAERDAILHEGKPVPLAVSVDYKDAKVDVTTPRDLLFEGYVVEIENKTQRLPSIFMNVAKLHKIDPAKEDIFTGVIQRSNLEFCHNLQNEFGVKIPLSWFAGAGAISHVTGCKEEQQAVDVMARYPATGALNPFVTPTQP